jgi:hypothetical protein
LIYNAGKIRRIIVSSNKVVISLKMDVAKELIPKLEDVIDYIAYPTKKSMSEFDEAHHTIDFLIDKLKYYIKKAEKANS